MLEVVLVNLKNGERFSKYFSSLFLCRKFVNKCKYSKSVRVLSHPAFD